MRCKSKEFVLVLFFIIFFQGVAVTVSAEPSGDRTIEMHKQYNYYSWDDDDKQAREDIERIKDNYHTKSNEYHEIWIKCREKCYGFISDYEKCEYDCKDKWNAHNEKIEEEYYAEYEKILKAGQERYKERHTKEVEEWIRRRESEEQ